MIESYFLVPGIRSPGGSRGEGAADLLSGFKRFKQGAAPVLQA
jgi:hypothetical protein